MVSDLMAFVPYRIRQMDKKANFHEVCNKKGLSYRQLSRRKQMCKRLKEVKDVAVKIRLRRMGKKKAPFYRVVVADSRSPRDGRFIEEIGTYDPSQDPSVFKFDEEKAKKWLANGAKPTETVGKLMKQAGIM